MWCMSVSGCSQLNQLVGGDLLAIMVIMHLLVRGSIYCVQCMQHNVDSI